jgi:hypothetical protein
MEGAFFLVDLLGQWFQFVGQLAHSSTPTSRVALWIIKEASASSTLSGGLYRASGVQTLTLDHAAKYTCFILASQPLNFSNCSKIVRFELA